MVAQSPKKDPTRCGFRVATNTSGTLWDAVSILPLSWSSHANGGITIISHTTPQLSGACSCLSSQKFGTFKSLLCFQLEVPFIHRHRKSRAFLICSPFLFFNSNNYLFQTAVTYFMSSVKILHTFFNWSVASRIRFCSFLCSFSSRRRWSRSRRR